MSRADRLIQKQRDKDARNSKSSTIAQEQLVEEQQFKDNLVGYVNRKNEPLVYELDEGGTITVPSVTDDGHEMTYHDQHYQIRRYHNGLPIEAKRMCDYRFDIPSSNGVERLDDNVSLSVDVEPSEAFKAMKEAHEQQHPPED